MSNSPHFFDIAIIGGGVSGTLVAIHLLRQAPEGTQLALIERRPPVGRGVAYGPPSSGVLLNVPANLMGAFPADPGHFARWIEQNRGLAGIPDDFQPDDFVPRSLYGRYVTELFERTRSSAEGRVSLTVVDQEIVDLEELPGGGGILHTTGGTSLSAGQVVLALGNLPGSYPIARPLKVYATPQYVHVPWKGDALEGLSPDDTVLLVGQGLTAADLIVQLARRGHRGTIHALSRNGQRPQVHRPVAAYPCFLDHEPPPTTMRALVRRIRREVRLAASQGIDWRAVIDGLRPHTQAVWQALPWNERARFMRHVRPFWEGHRHRVPPMVGDVIEGLLAKGTLQLHAGRLQTLDLDGDGVVALIRSRGSIQHKTLRVNRVINCTGPRTDYSKYQHPLYVHLLARGLIDHDPLALGIAALPTGEVLRYRGAAVGWLFTLGAPLKGILWETTAVREIRAQAEALATRLLANATLAQPA